MFKKSHVNDITIVEVTINKLDMSVAADFQYAFKDLVSDVDGVVLMDLAQVGFMDSSGLAAFVFCFQQVNIKQNLAICNVGERVRELFKLTKMDKMVSIYGTRTEALAALTEKAKAG